jgi:hypothetical protein
VSGQVSNALNLTDHEGPSPPVSLGGGPGCPPPLRGGGLSARVSSEKSQASQRETRHRHEVGTTPLRARTRGHSKGNSPPPTALPLVTARSTPQCAIASSACAPMALTATRTRRTRSTARLGCGGRGIRVQHRALAHRLDVGQRRRQRRWPSFARPTASALALPVSTSMQWHG